MLESRRSICYGCGGPIHNYSMLICLECLDDECQEFENLTSSNEELEIEEVA